MPGYEVIGKEELAAINEWFPKANGVLFAHGFLGQRNGIFKVREFEAAIAGYLKAGFCQAVSSGSAALVVALRALGIRPGDEVITQAFTFIATVEAIIEAGAIPVITEVDESFNMDVEDLERKITPRTKAIIPVHMAGSMADLDRILPVARKHNLKVLEDSAQNFGGRHNGKFLGTIGDAGCFSLDFAKTITTGEGGLIITADKSIYEKTRAYHDHGHDYNPAVPRGRDTRSQSGFNYRMSEIQAVIGLAQLKKADTVIAEHRRVKALLKSKLAAGNLKFRKIIDPEADIADALFFTLESEAKALHVTQKLQEAGFGTKNLPDAIDWHYAGTWGHMLDQFAHLNPCRDKFPKTERLIRSSIALPISMKTSDDEIQKVAETVLKALK